MFYPSPNASARHAAALLAATLVALWGLCSCANPGSGPDGGPYDETPPHILRTQPAYGATACRSRKISILFDEAVKMENASEKVVISPPQVEMPEIKTSGRRISVELMDSLLPNTTYTIDFSDAIVDMTEGNPLGNYTYCFTTSTEVDTLEVAGYVLQADDLEPVKGILVGLHRCLDDSAFTARPFDRVARTDGSGHFSVKGVAAGEYRAYALKDMDNDFRYARGEMLAFSRDTLRPSSFADTRADTLWADTTHIDTIRQVPYTHFTPDNVVLLAFTEANASRQLLKYQREPAYFRTFFTAPSAHRPQVRGLDFDAANLLREECSAGCDTITYWLTDSALFKRDTLTVAYTYEQTNDSTLAPQLVTDTLILVPPVPYERRMKMQQAEAEKQLKKQQKRQRRGAKLPPLPPTEPLDMHLRATGSMPPNRNILLQFDEPVDFDSTRLHLMLRTDSAHFEPAAFRLDTVPHSLRHYWLRAAWRPGQVYRLEVDSACFRGLSGKVNARNESQFDIALTDKFGALFIVLQHADSTATVQLLNGAGQVVQQQRAVDGRADFFYLDPGKYYMRLFYDRNLNGKWDAGRWNEQRTPEEMFYYPREMQVRANWDIEQTWNPTAVPLNEQKPRELVKQKADKKKTPRNLNAERERLKRG